MSVCVFLETLCVAGITGTACLNRQQQRHTTLNRTSPGLRNKAWANSLSHLAETHMDQARPHPHSEHATHLKTTRLRAASPPYAGMKTVTLCWEPPA